MAQVSRLLISFSGGETSAFMTTRLLSDPKWEEKVIVFANTGEENEETLLFVKRCQDGLFGYPVVWVEAMVHPGRVGTTHRIVTFETASRNGEPFESVIQKYGIPNQKFPHCTRELKVRPIHSYMRSLKWPMGTYDVAIGIRADEIDRAKPGLRSGGRAIYPLAESGVTKSDVNSFWQNSPFRLNLMNYEGNCKWCWKKSFRKLMTIATDTPERFDFPERMEKLYGKVGPEFRKLHREGYKRTFFRGNKSTVDIREMARNTTLTEANPVLDVDDGGCAEHCEV